MNDNSRTNSISRPVEGLDRAEVLIDRDGDIHLNTAGASGTVYINGVAYNGIGVEMVDELPAEGTVGSIVFLTEDPIGFYFCEVTNVWSQVFTAGNVDDVVSPAFTALTDAATVTLTCSATKAVQNATVTLGGNRTLDIVGEANGMTGVLIVKQDATGSRTLALPAASKVIGGGAGAITLTTTANAIDVLSWVYDGTNFLWTKGLNFS